MPEAAARKRIDAVDGLRGFAVLGIFVINILSFSLPEAAGSNPIAVGGGGALNHGLWTAATLYAQGSMRGLFSLLFGASFILYTAKEAKGRGDVADLYCRRTIWLIVFGLVHEYVLRWPGDILLIYGLAGLFLYPFRAVSPPKLIAATFVILALLVAYAASNELAERELGVRAIIAAEKSESGAALIEEEKAAIEEWSEIRKSFWPEDEQIREETDRRTGDPADVFVANAQTVADWSETGDLIFWTSEAFMMMLFGMALLKWRILTGERSAKFYVMMLLCGYGAGLALGGYAVHAQWRANFDPMVSIGPIFDQPRRVAMTLGHIGFFMLLWKAFFRSTLLQALRATGRMALTNYIAQTVIANLIFSGVGLAMFGRFDRAQVYLIMIGIWATQLVFSVFWLRGMQMGPLEWLWRSLTYWKRQPLKNPHRLASVV